MEFSRLSCWSVVVSSLPPPPAPEHTEEELSTARPSASSTSRSIRPPELYFTAQQSPPLTEEGWSKKREERKGRSLQSSVPTDCVQLDEQNNNVKQTVKGINRTAPSGKSLCELQDRTTGGHRHVGDPADRLECTCRGKRRQWGRRSSSINSSEPFPSLLPCSPLPVVQETLLDPLHPRVEDERLVDTHTDAQTQPSITDSRLIPVERW
ncbi:hypothetical protein EYF80_046474 [Liparis tanakae]|uniref:Uncharacterized protein n=1 Tax=Liparis tanakae TaxID=230148 RepID=A0A4Z2FQD0_9TELE|nr:hypothetical protein EYF80_046474 [Liparis tanakae]